MENHVSEIIKADYIDVLTRYPEGYFDMCLIDPPYGVTNCGWDVKIDLDQLWAQLNRVIKINGCVAIFASGNFYHKLVASNIKHYKYEWVWEKTSATGHMNAKKRPLLSHEFIVVFYKKQPCYNPQKTFGHVRKISSASHKRNSRMSDVYGKSINTSYDSEERYPRSVVKFKSDKQKINLHPSQKPLELIEYLIKTYTNEGDIVLDCFAGSCTVAIACDNLSRKWVCIEKNEKFYNNGATRVSDNQERIKNGL